MEFVRKPFTFFSRGSKKRGLSAIVATVLIILITITAVVIFWVAILPVIQENVLFVEEVRLSIVVDRGYYCF